MSWLLAMVLASASCANSKDRATSNKTPTAQHSASSHATPGNAPPNYAVNDTLLPHRELTIISQVLGEMRRINIYVPPGYDASPNARYPILYMPDGGTKEDFPHLTHTVDGAIRAGQIRPIVVVGIENTKRRRDLTGPTEVAKDKKAAPVVGGSAKFRRFIRYELFPKVMGQIRGDGTTGIIGESLAGLFIVETFFVAPRMFDIYVGIDPTLGWNAGELARNAVERLKVGSWQGRALHLSSAGKGRNDGNSVYVAPLAAALEKHPPEGLRWIYTPKPDEKHSTIYRATKLAILRWMFPTG